MAQIRSQIKIPQIRRSEAVLPVALDPCELAGFGIESVGEVALVVASRSPDIVLLPGQRPVWPNLGIEVNVDFVDVEGDLTRREVVNQPLNRLQTLRPAPFWPRTIDGQFGLIQSNPQPSQEPTHRGDADVNACSFGE
jgi:hypothetical protein